MAAPKQNEAWKSTKQDKVAWIVSNYSRLNLKSYPASRDIKAMGPEEKKAHHERERKIFLEMVEAGLMSPKSCPRDANIAKLVEMATQGVVA